MVRLSCREAVTTGLDSTMAETEFCSVCSCAFSSPVEFCVPLIQRLSLSSLAERPVKATDTAISAGQRGPRHACKDCGEPASRGFRLARLLAADQALLRELRSQRNPETGRRIGFLGRPGTGGLPDGVHVLDQPAAVGAVAQVRPCNRGALAFHPRFQLLQK